VGIDPGAAVTGISFDQVDGIVYWDKTGVVHHPASDAAEPFGDMMWAMVVSPEFQFIR
jgi:hypothetical protein